MKHKLRIIPTIKLNLYIYNWSLLSLYYKKQFRGRFILPPDLGHTPINLSDFSTSQAGCEIQVFRK